MLRDYLGERFVEMFVSVKRTEHRPLAEVEAIYDTLPGWRGNLTGVKRFEELPKEAQQYVKRIEKLIGAPIKIVSVGAERGATIFR